MAKLTNEQLAEIRQRADAATEGPWEQTNGTDVFTRLGVTNSEGITADKSDGWQIADTSIGVTFVDGELFEMERREQFDNATFIAECRTDVPALLDMIAELQAEVERKKEAEHLLSNAYDMLDDVHCYDTDLYREITRYLYGEDDDE